MSYASASLAYRRATTQQASPVGLVIALYDTLVADLQRATAAMQRADLPSIEERSNRLRHALQILGQLNALVDTQNGGSCAANLVRFYEHLRQRTLAAQFRQEAAILEAEIPRILEVRAAWQQVDSRAPETVREAEPGEQGGHTEETVNESFSCSA